MAAGATTLSLLEAYTKTKYDQKNIEILAYDDDPFIPMIRKDRGFGGKDARISLGYGNPQGGSVDFATAQAGATSTLDVAFLVTRKNDYHVALITGEAMDGVKGDANTVYDGFKRVLDGAIYEAGASLEVQAYGNGGGARGQIGSGQGTPTITLKDTTQIVNFQVGMQVQLSDADGSGSGDALRDTGASVTITARNADAGTLTISGNWTSGISGAAGNDYIFRKGDFKGCPPGLAGWVPLTAPGGSDSFLGVNRSADVTRLAGCRWTGTGSYEETLVRAAARLRREAKAKLKLIALVNEEEFASIALSMQSKVTYDSTKSSDGAFSFASLKFHGPGGDIPIMGSKRVKKGEFYLVNPESWVLKSNDGAPHIITNDGLRILRSATADSYEVRLVSRWAIGCECPAYNLHGTFPTAA